MAKYINAAEAAEKVAEATGIRIADLVDVFAEISAADVAPVVRCKDCKHFNFEHMECENEAVSTDHEGGASYSLNFYLDDFCSYGERKEGTND